MTGELLGAVGPDPFSLAADLLDPPGGGVETYYSDPVRFAKECIRWDAGHGPTAYQERVLRSLVADERVCVRGPHSLGKTALNSWVVLWFALTRDARGVDWKVITTASAWRQLEKYLWPEIRKWSMRVRWGIVGRQPFTQAELMRLGLRLTHGEAIAVACEDPATIEGAHADSLLYLYDEAKRLDVATPLPTPTGWTTMGEVRVGDEVLDEAGLPTEVTYVSPVLTGRPCKRVTFADGASLIADDGHFWGTLSSESRETAGVRDWRERWDLAEVVQTVDLDARAAIPTCGRLELPEAPLPIDPYLLGASLGDIPAVYLRASAEQRLELLRGLMDTDGSVTGEDARVSFTTTRPSLAEGVAELVRTFGWKVESRERPAALDGVSKKLAHTLLWSADVCCFHVPRKAEEWCRTAQAPAATIWTVVSVEAVASVPTRCIAVASARHLYLAGENFIPTHNTIPGETFDASEGAFMGAGAETAQEAFAIATSTPGLPNGRFYEIQTRIAGTEDWTALQVTKDELVKAGRMSASRADARRRQWGADSAVYINRVEGNFAESETDGIIKLSWVEAANERWLEWAAAGLDLEDGQTGLVPTARAPMEGVHGLILDHDPVLARAVTAVGQDVAESGGDKTIIAVRWGNVIGEIRRCPRGDPIQSANYAHNALESAEGSPPIIVDKIGIGAGTAAQLRVLEHFVIAFDAREKTLFRDQSGELEFLNVRAAAWWRLRDLLDPVNGHDIALPPDDQLTGDLTAPHWKQHTSGKLLVESKEELRKRIGRSTDTGDAVVQAFWFGAVGIVSEPLLLRRESRWAPLRETTQSAPRAGGLARA